jgi:hypothetical protein
MARLRMQVVGDEVRLESDRGFREVQPNRMLLSKADSKGRRVIHAIGTYWPPDDEVPPDAEERRVFDVDTFNPDLAAAWIRFWDGKSRKGIRGHLSHGTIELRWPDWPKLAKGDRESMLRSISAYDVIVNGTPRILRRRFWRPFADAITFVP